MIELTVIVPVYNVERYIRQCLDSILSSTFKDWECILIDDGSIDNSGAICDEYVEKDSRFKAIHKKNGGVSSARNRGLDEAKGKWITFIDADDFISPTFFEGLLKPTIGHEELDFIQGGCTNWADGKVIGINQQYADFVGVDIAKLLNEFRGLTVSKLFSLENVNHWTDGLPLRFDKKMNIAEDMAFTLDYLTTISKYAFSSEIGYFYRRDNLGSLTKHTSGQTFEKALYGWKHIYGSFINNCKLNNIDPLSLEHRRSVMGGSISSVINTLYQSYYSRTQRLKHLKEDFSSEEIKYLCFYSSSNRIIKLTNSLLLEKKYLLFDLSKMIYHNVFVCGSFIKRHVIR